ncbi:MAG: acetylornithine transaminase [candidate division NC10 bacterium]|nr:acetylornithine transaminase [candidate division NC10 bacterium]
MASMEELIRESQRYLMNTYARFPVVIEKGEGVRVWDTEGKEYLDFVAGIAVNNLGHCHPKVVGAIKEQAEKLIHISNLYHIEPQIRLAKLLCQRSFAKKAFFCNSGAEANEAAIKLARKYAKERWSSDRYEIITTYNSFHGRTLGSLAATGQEKYQHGFEPLIPGFKYVPYNDLRAMERAVDAHTAAILVEPIQGEGGVYVPGDDYLPGIRRLCDEAGALFILDEIQTGMGRTGKLFAYQHWGASPDIMTLAKGLGGGLPIGAMLAREEVAEHFTPGSHGSTFGGTPFVTAVAFAALSALLEENLPERAVKMGGYLMAKLEELKGRYPFVKEIRGKGLLVAAELEADAKALVRRCLEKGLLLNAVSDKALRFMPPLIVTEADVDRAITMLDEVFQEMPK